jgi:Rrf2 family protein
VKVSQKLEYACRSMIQLGKSCTGDQVSRVDDLAEKESISSTFLVQILNDLRRAGLVQSRRGKMGGYCLAMAPSEITMSAIVKAVEGSVLGIDSVEVAEHLEAKMTSITLQEMMSNEGLLEYYI